MNDTNERLKKKLCRDLDQYADKGELNASDLQNIHLLTDTIKNFDKISMLEESGGYSNDSGYSGNGVNSYRGGNSYRGYSNGNGYPAGNGYSNGRYPMDDGKEHFARQIRQMMDGAPEYERMALQRALDALR